jgi:hypothetical protein
MNASGAARLRAGAAKVEVSQTGERPVNDPLYARALVLTDGTGTVVLVSVDVVTIAELGIVQDDFLPNVRSQLQNELHLEPPNILISVTHCHGEVCADLEQRTVQAVKEAWGKMVPVTVGAGRGHEDRIMENRRVKLKNGREADVRQNYCLPPDDQVVGVGPVDPEIGILRLDREDGRTLAVVYNFACHPIQEVPSGGNTADISGFASGVIEENLSDGTIALFTQGCGADVNPAFYKGNDIDYLRDAEPLGNRLGLNTLKALRKIRTREDGRLELINETLELPRADLTQLIDEMEGEQRRLLESLPLSLTSATTRGKTYLKGTTLNFKTFLTLFVQYHLFPEYPSYYSYRYLHEEMMGRDDLVRLDAQKKWNMDHYLEKIYTMEELTKIQINIAMLKKKQASNAASDTGTIEAEVVGLRVGDFALVTFPGELPVEIGLGIKQRSPHKFTFVAGVTNGYLFYTPTVEQLKNRGRAQEDTDCLVAPEWQALFESKVAEILEEL